MKCSEIGPQSLISLFFGFSFLMCQGDGLNPNPMAVWSFPVPAVHRRGWRWLREAFAIPPPHLSSPESRLFGF